MLSDVIRNYIQDTTFLYKAHTVLNGLYVSFVFLRCTIGSINTTATPKCKLVFVY